MIKKNQALLNRLNVLSDALVIYALLPLAFWLRFYVFPGGVISVPLSHYLVLGVGLTAAQLFTYSAFGLYRSFRHIRLTRELSRLFWASALVMAVVLSALFVQHRVLFSRWTLAIFFCLELMALGGKRVVLRAVLRRLREKGYNQKHVLILGGGAMARRYLAQIRTRRELGYRCVGYVAAQPEEGWEEGEYLGPFEDLTALLERLHPDEAVSAIDMADYRRTPEIIAACEKTGTKLSIIPFYAEYMTATPQFDDLGGIPLMNVRRIPLDSLGWAACKRGMDIVGSLALLILTAPVMLVCAVGVKLSSPGPVLFRQERIGRNKKPFLMYKFRSMRLNDREQTGWSGARDGRRTPFGAFMRKCSLDELPQLVNVLRGEMSLVGPRPEVPYYVERFKEEVPLYMVKHQVRPGITGWAQVNGWRGDTSIRERVEHDVYYIEHWSLSFDLKILLMTVFGGKFINREEL